MTSRSLAIRVDARLFVSFSYFLVSFAWCRFFHPALCCPAFTFPHPLASPALFPRLRSSEATSSSASGRKSSSTGKLGVEKSRSDRGWVVEAPLMPRHALAHSSGHRKTRHENRKSPLASLLGRGRTGWVPSASFLAARLGLRYLLPLLWSRSAGVRSGARAGVGAV